MKKAKGGKLNEEQREEIEFLTEQGYLALVCYGANEARNVIQEYLKGEI